jgi:hypothetical protein
MNQEAQVIAIAEACGWEHLDPDEQYWGLHRWKKGDDVAHEWEELPWYLGNLNAMEEAEKILSEEQMHEYTKELTLVVDPYFAPYMWRATADQRAKAFLKTIGKWTED